MMETFAPLNDRILVPLDGSALALEAIPVATRLASPGSTLILCQIVPESPRLDDGPIRGATTDGTQQQAAAALRALAERMLPAGDPRFEIAVATGDPAERILTVAKERAAGMIVMSSHGRGAATRALFGSVADRVARTAAMPVVVVHPTADSPPIARVGARRMVVPLDDTPLSHQAIPVAAALARRRRLPVLLVSAVDAAQIDSPLTGYAAAMSNRAYHNAIGSLKSEALRQLESAGARLMREGVVVTWRLLAGPPARVIPAVLSAGDLVVLASHRLGGLERWWRGSLAEDLIESGAAPVMMVGAAPPPPPADTHAMVEPVTHA